MDLVNLIAVKSLAGAKGVKRRFDAIITIEDPFFKNGLRFHNAPHPDQLVMWFEDVDHPWDTVALPKRLHVQAALSFAREHAQRTLLIHCKAGVARSTAIALGIIADRLGSGKEDEAVETLMKIRPESIPNLILLDLIDDTLQRNGRLKEAWMRIENSSKAYADHRELKVKTFKNFPSAYAQAPSDGVCTAWRYRPNSLKRESSFAVMPNL